MIRFIETGESTVISSNGGKEEHLVFDKDIWKEARRFFKEHKAAELIPVMDKDSRVVCSAWRDEEADREIRMLRELETCECAIGFRDLHPECAGVTIHGCNELAYHFVEYLIKRGIPVNVEGKYWMELGSWEKHTIPDYCNYEVFAEGVHQKSRDWKQERLRSASVEFECVDEIYEANIKAGNITDAQGDVNDLLGRLRREKEIVIRGTGTKAQDAYDWLVANGIDICAFQSGKEEYGRKSLFGKPILRKEEVEKRFTKAVVIECASKHSAWGFGGVDAYDYEGYERNERYLLLRDYIEVPENNLVHILNGKNLFFVGDSSLCKRASRWWKQHGINIGEMEYWDVLGERAGHGLSENDVCLLVTVQYDSPYCIKKEVAGICNTYIHKLREYNIQDYSNYFSDITKCIQLETDNIKFHKRELCPAGILLGAIPDHRGNALVKQSLAGHPQIMVIEECGYFNCDLYLICIRLAEEKSDNILQEFRRLYQKEAGGVYDIFSDSFDKGRFYCKFAQLLGMKEQFTSQELFVLLHIAYEVGFGREISNIEHMIIYWEPHHWNREVVREFAVWLGSDRTKGYILDLVRNRYIYTGSRLRSSEMEYNCWMGATFDNSYIKKRRFKNWSTFTMKFEDLKCNPEKTLRAFSGWIGILFNDSLLETTWHGGEGYYDGEIKGFDIRPAYRLYEEYFTSFDRMRICIIAGSYQKQFGYPFVMGTDFSRRELQEMFLKNFRWENMQLPLKGKNEESVWRIQRRIRHLLLLERFSEIMEIDVEEEY